MTAHDWRERGKVMLPAKEFFGSSLDELRTYFGVAVAVKPEIKRECLEGGCVLLTLKEWRAKNRPPARKDEPPCLTAIKP